MCLHRGTTGGRVGVFNRRHGRRWTIEEGFQAAKNFTGFDQYQVRRWISRHRWTVHAMLAFAVLTARAETSTPQA